MSLEIKMLWSFSSSIYKVTSFQEEIDEVYSYIRSIYSDISDAHISSAKQAIKAAENSNYSANEILDAIAHLRDAYNISKSALYKTRETRFLLFFKDTEDLIPDYEKLTYCQSIAHIAGVISILYKAIHQNGNSNEWKSIALNDYKVALSYLYLDVDELKRINKSYVEEYEAEEEIVHGGVDTVATGTRTVTKERPTAYGEEYFENQKTSMLENFNTTITEKRLSL